MPDKYIYFNGLKFTRDDKTGYYLNSTIRKRLHRYVWEYYNGDIPAGYDIHHKDKDKSNNDISNLEMLEKAEHRQFHAEHLTEDEKAKLRDNLNKNARPAALLWHKSDKGREWHKQHYNDFADRLHQMYDVVCKNCGKEFQGQHGAAFCCNACKSAYRRHAGIDNVAKVCPVCGNVFVSNKYAKVITCSRSCANVYKARVRRESKICTAT